MDQAYVWLFPLLGIIGLIALSAVIAKKRRDGLRAWALQHGAQYEADGDSIVSALSSFKLIGRSRRRKAYNVVTSGSGDEERWVFDFRYRVGTGKNSSTYRQTVVAFPYLNANLPAFEVRPEHVFHRLGASLGYQDIDFHEHPHFSSKFLLRGQDESRIREFFDSQAVQGFDAVPRHCVEAAGSCILVYKHRESVGVHRLGDFVRKAETLRDAFVTRATRLGWTQTRSAELVGV